ncbi:MAG TPA: efflux RND transporter periplasmic adaptor subunit [Firmicutes bacterium]|nr:efflux RND transporter periplasmic adaptor subunit [Bacillota bacterium]
MKKNVKLILWVTVIVIIFAYALYAYFRPLAADLLEARPQDLEKSFTEEGTVISYVEQEIFSLGGGKVRELHVRQGTAATAGDLLLVMDTEELELQQAQLEGQLIAARGQRQTALRSYSPAHVARQTLAIEQAQLLAMTAETDYAHYQELYAAGAVSRKALEETERRFIEAQNMLSQQKLALDLLMEKITPPPGTAEQFSGLLASLQAQQALVAYRIKQSSVFAPFDGVIGEVFAEEGAILPPGAPLLHLFQPDRLRVEVFLLSADMEQVQPGMPVSITYAGGIRDHLFAGEVHAIAPAAIETVSPLGLVEQRVKVTVEPAGEMNILRPGYAVDVRFVTHQAPGKLAVPETAIFKDNGADALWVVRRGRAVIQQVKKGLELDEKVIIEDGLKAGDLVIRNPRLEGLAPGKRITEK